jgi:hypothetical protein
MVYEETFLRNFRFYAKTLTKLHDLTGCDTSSGGQCFGSGFRIRIQEGKNDP